MYLRPESVNFEAGPVARQVPLYFLCRIIWLFQHLVLSRVIMDKNVVVKPRVLVVIGSASKQSSNLRLMEAFQQLSAAELDLRIVDNLEELPHFDPILTESQPPQVVDLLKEIETSDGVVLCTPEYIFSIPSRLKNLLEWCVSTIVFNDKPVGLITASADGQRGHAELLLIMQTLGAKLSEGSAMLIKGIKGKFVPDGKLKDPETERALVSFLEAFRQLLRSEL